MNNKKIVAVLYDENNDKNSIMLDLLDEGYKDIEFNYLDCNSMDKNGLFIVKISKEVWTFGNVENTYLYKVARTLGKDIWKMGE